MLITRQSAATKIDFLNGISVRTWRPWLYEISAPSVEINNFSGVVTNPIRTRACCDVCRVMQRNVLSTRSLARFLRVHRRCGL